MVEFEIPHIEEDCVQAPDKTLGRGKDISHVKLAQMTIFTAQDLEEMYLKHMKELKLRLKQTEE
jgi:hypothetical protein